MKTGAGVAASEFSKVRKYNLDLKNPTGKPADWKTGFEIVAYYKDWFQKCLLSLLRTFST